MPDVIVVGGGVIGLSIAWELAGHGVSVKVLERGAFGREASWAGAGMLTPGNLSRARTSEARFRGAAHQLWPEWSDRLTSQTSGKNDFSQCGGLEVRFADDPDGEPDFQTGLDTLRDEGVLIESEDVELIRERCPALSAEITRAYSMPDFRQVRNPRHLQTLQLGCTLRGVELVSNSPVRRIEFHGDRIESVQGDSETHRASEYIFAGGAWSKDLLAQAGIGLEIEPVKGQMVLLRAELMPFRCVIQLGHRYLVPRNDGLILIGSTEERTGFDKRNTASAIGDLIQFGRRIVPCLSDATFETCWAGLRPYSATGRPQIGRLPQFSNAYVAAGHYRYGLHLSPITAVLIRQLLLNQTIMLPEDVLN